MKYINIKIAIIKETHTNIVSQTIHDHTSTNTDSVLAQYKEA